MYLQVATSSLSRDLSYAEECSYRGIIYALGCGGNLKNVPPPESKEVLFGGCDKFRRVKKKCHVMQDRKIIFVYVFDLRRERKL